MHKTQQKETMAQAHTHTHTHLVDHSASINAASLVGVWVVFGRCRAVICLVAVLAHLCSLQRMIYLFLTMLMSDLLDFMSWHVYNT